MIAIGGVIISMNILPGSWLSSSFSKNVVLFVVAVQGSLVVYCKTSRSTQLFSKSLM